MSKRLFNLKATLIPLLALFSSNLKAQEVHAFSIQEAIDYAKKNNLKVKNSLIDLEIQQQTNKSITAQALPELYGTAGTNAYFQTPVTLVPAEFAGGTPGTYVALSFQQKYSANAGITLNQTLFDGQIFVGLKARQSSLDYYQKAIDLTVEAISVNIYKIYYQLVVSRTQIQQLDANIARGEKLLNDAKLMFENGFQEQLDIDKANVQLANLQTAKLTTQNTVNNGYLALKYLLGMPVKDSVVLTSDFSEDDLKTGILDDTAHKYEDRFDYQALQITQRLNRFDIRRYRALYYPTVKLTGAYLKNAYSNEYDFFSKSGNWYSTSYVGASINIPIFSGFSKDANLKKSRLQSIQTDNQLTDLKNSIDNDIAQAQNSFRSAVLTLDYQKKNMVLAESVYNQTKKKYESGLASNTDITNAQTDLITAQTNYINALYEAVIAKIDYTKATGKL